MKGNPTAGILLMAAAAALIVLAFTEKGKLIFSILAGQMSPISSSGGGGTFRGGGSSGGVSFNKTPGAFTGEKGAESVT
jgi:hypothetical protein